MNTAKVTQRQSIFDVAVQHCGSFEAAFDIAALNNIGLTDDLAAGNSLALPEPTDSAAVRTLAVNRQLPATGCTQEEILDVTGQGEGIEFWIVESDFIVQ